jgi:hypothetical protein
MTYRTLVSLLCGSALVALGCDDVAKQLETDPGLPSVLDREIVQTESSRRLTSLMESLKTAQRDRIELMVEDITRTVELDEVRARRLRIAAAGALEYSLNGVRNNIVRDFEYKVVAATRHNVKLLAKDFTTHYSPSAPENSILWKETLHQVLTPEQLTAWRTTVKQREVLRAQSYADFVLVELEDELSLSAEQIKKLQPLISTCVMDYLPDLFSIYSDESFSTHQARSLLLGIDEKQVREILPTDTQWKAWQKASEDVGGMWNFIKETHQRRLAEEKSEKEP